MTLEARNLSYKVKNQHLISEITLTFKPGCLYGVLGPNGSGKTTLLKNLAGIWMPTSGEVLWEGKNLLNQPRQHISRVLSLVPQAGPIPFDFTVEDIVSMGRYSHAEEKKELVDKALSAVHVTELRRRPLSQLSGGERQRVYIARALATEAPVLLLDEPTSHLDIRHQLEIWKLLKTLASEQRTVIVTVHHLGAAQHYCDQVAVLSKGACVTQGTYKDIVTSELLQDVFGIGVVDSGFGAGCDNQEKWIFGFF